MSWEAKLGPLEILFVGVVAFSAAHEVSRLLFHRWAYRVGIRIYRKTCRLPRLSPDLDPLRTDHALFTVDSPDEVLFRRRAFKFEMFQSATTGTIRWNGVNAEVECRIGPTLFIAVGAILFATAAERLPGLARGFDIGRLSGVLFFSLFGAMVLALVLRIESSRCGQLVEEYEQAQRGLTSISTPTATAGEVV